MAATPPTSHPRRFAPALALCLLATVAGAQQVPDARLSELRPQIYELLTWQCGVREVGSQFREAIAAIGGDAQPVLIAVLEDGLPQDVRRRIESHAAQRYERRQAWLAADGEELFGADTRRLATATRDDFVADAVRRNEILFRENAVRGLAVVGNAEAAAAVSAAAARYPYLEPLAQDALGRLGQQR